MSENYEVERFRHTKPSYENGIVSSEKSNDVEVLVHPHALKHGLSEEDVVTAWRNPLRCRMRLCDEEPQRWIAIGALADGRMAELVAIETGEGGWLVYHAMVPPTKKFLKELEMERRA